MQETQKMKNMAKRTNTGIDQCITSWIKTNRKDVADLSINCKNKTREYVLNMYSLEINYEQNLSFNIACIILVPESIFLI